MTPRDPLTNALGFGSADFALLFVSGFLAFTFLFWPRISPWTDRLASRTLPSMATLVVLCIVLRLALLPFYPVPTPSGADDFGYLLLSDTLSHFRLANPPHPLHQFFEANFVLQEPAYASMYALGQGIALAFGQIVFGSPWIGVLVSVAAFCALCYWMLRGWISPTWSLFGGFIAICLFGPLSRWTNSYWGGAVSGIAGCLVFGALPRFARFRRKRDACALGVGLAIQFLTRPFESVLLMLCAGLFVFAFFERRTNRQHILRPAALAAAPILFALVLIGLHNRAVTHSWTTIPYSLHRYQYGTPTVFTFQQNLVPHRLLTPEQAMDYKAESIIHGPGSDSPGAYSKRLFYRLRYLRFFLLPPLYFGLLFFVPRLRELRFLLAAMSIGLFIIGTNFFPYFHPHYMAAVACLLLLCAVGGLERLSGITVQHLPAGLYAARVLAALCVAQFLFWYTLTAIGPSRDSLTLREYETWDYIGWGDAEGRLAVDRTLASSPGKQLVFVHYSPGHGFHEWIHNAADIDASHVVWALDLGTTENQKLVQYYRDRKLWLLQPDYNPPKLTPYKTETAGFQNVE